MANVLSTLSTQAFPMGAYPGDPDIDFEADYERWLLGMLFDRHGIGQIGELALAQNGGGSWSFTIAPGNIIVPGYTTAERYFVRLNSTLTVDVSTLNTAPAAIRTHKVYVAVYDKNYAGSEYAAKIFVGEDTGSGSPSPTGSPVGSTQIGQFTISPSQTSILTAHITNNPVYADRGAPYNNLTYAGGFVDPTSGVNPMQYQRVGNKVYLRGRVGRTAGALFAAGTTYTVCTLPTTLRPPGSRELYFSTGADISVAADPGTARVHVSNSGALNVRAATSTGNQPGWIALDGIHYDMI